MKTIRELHKSPYYWLEHIQLDLWRDFKKKIDKNKKKYIEYCEGIKTMNRYNLYEDINVNYDILHRFYFDGDFYGSLEDFIKVSLWCGHKPIFFKKRKINVTKKNNNKNK